MGARLSQSELHKAVGLAKEKGLTVHRFTIRPDGPIIVDVATPAPGTADCWTGWTCPDETSPAYVYERTRKSGTYIYHEAPGATPVRLMSRPGTPEFQIELAEAMKSRRPMPSGRSFKVLIASYRASRK